jgi:predicted RND superfamily exporter protein
VGLCAILVTKMGSFYFTSKLLNLETIMRKERFPFHSRSLVTIGTRKGLVISLVLTMALALTASRVGFEFDFDKMMEHSEESRETDKLINVIYDRSTSPSAFAANTREEAVALGAYVKANYMPKVVQSLVNGGGIIPEHQADKLAIIQRVGKLIRPISDRALTEAAGVQAAAIRKWVNAVPFVWEDLPVYVQEALRGTQQAGYLVYVYPAENLNNGPAVERFASMIKDVEAHFPGVVSGSDAGIFSEILDLIKRDGIILAILIVLLVGVVIWISIRDLKHTLLSYVSFLISLPAGIGLMAIFGVKFNIFNVALLPVFMAAGVEIPIQLMQRSGEIKSGFKGVQDIAVGLQLALVTTAVGFGVLIFTRAGVLKSLGWMSILLTLAGWAIGLFLHPAILEWFFRWEERRERVAAPLNAKLADPSTEG